jgi:hypothetical protein
MPFPFIPGGVLLALSVLGGAIALFGLGLKALNWSIDGVKGSMLSGVVSGFRDWESRSQRRTRRVSPFSTEGPSGTAPESMMADDVDASGTAQVTLERVHPSEASRR